MSRLRVYRTEGVVIRQMPLGEADRILTLCSPDMGKVRAVAKGVRRTRSRLGGHLELLNRVSVSVAIGRNLDTIKRGVRDQHIQWHPDRPAADFSRYVCRGAC